MKKPLFDKLLAYGSLIGAIVFALFCLYFIYLILFKS